MDATKTNARAMASSWRSGREKGLPSIFLVFKLTVFLLLNYVEGDSIQAEFLRSNRRLLTSTYIDSYFCCNACGGGIQWLVNGEDAGGHLPSQKSGSLSYRTEFSDSTALRYTSVLLSSRSENDIICMDVVLLVTQLEAEYFSSPPLVICRGPTLQREIQTPTQQLVPDQRNNGTVSLTYVLSRSNIVSPGNNFVTHILLCSTNESAQFWLRNQLPAGGFNGIHSAGYSEFTLHSNDSSISFQEAVLLVKRPQVDLTSLLLLTDFNSSTNFSVLCVSNTNYVLSVINDSYSYLEELNADSASSVSTDSATIKTGTTDELTKTSGSSETATHDMENFLTGTYNILLGLGIVCLIVCTIVVILMGFGQGPCIIINIFIDSKHTWKSNCEWCYRKYHDVEHGSEHTSLQGHNTRSESKQQVGPGYNRAAVESEHKLSQPGPEHKLSQVKDTSIDGPEHKLSQVKDTSIDGPEHKHSQVKDTSIDGPEHKHSQVKDTSIDGPEHKHSQVKDTSIDGPEHKHSQVKDTSIDGPEHKHAQVKASIDGPEHKHSQVFDGPEHKHSQVKDTSIHGPEHKSSQEKDLNIHGPEQKPSEQKDTSVLKSEHKSSELKEVYVTTL